jgi:hypothetical protein
MKLVLIAVLSLVASANVHAQVGDQVKTIVTCRETSGLPNGMFIEITEGGFVGMTLAKISYRAGLGPVRVLATVPVKEVIAQGNMGAPRTYYGSHFSLTINVDSAPVAGGGHASQVIVTARGKVYNEALVCNLF